MQASPLPSAARRCPHCRDAHVEPGRSLCWDCLREAVVAPGAPLSRLFAAVDVHFKWCDLVDGGDLEE